MHLLADRFLRRHDCWFDIATAGRVAVVVHRAGSLREQIAWAERCAMLVRLRHPLLNPLIDFGAADPTSLFESYEASGPLATTPAAASRMMTHASRFLEAHGLPLTADAAGVLVRPVRRTATAARGRPLGIVLQPRRMLDWVAELLACPARNGSTSFILSGPPGSGLRTVRTTIAHLARVEGYVPVCPEAVVRWPELADLLSGRHLCLFGAGGGGRAGRAAAWLLARLAVRSARRHVCLTVERSPYRSPGAVHLDSMGTTSMSSMIYIDPDYGPSPADVFDAARRAHGTPGRFLTHLGAGAFVTLPPRHFTVHESAAAYGGAVEPDGPASRSRRGRSRIGSVLRRAGDRAAGLEGRGRHAAAGRLLARAARVLEGRGEAAEAARCWLQLAWIARNRGAVERALEHAERARRADSRAEAQVEAACLTAVCWTDESRLIEAEASLRNLAIAASALSDARLGHKCRLGLARVLYWDGRGHEALAAIEPLLSAADHDITCEAYALCSRARLQIGQLPGAVQAAREAGRRAIDAGALRLRIAASRALAEAFSAAGDTDSVRAQVAAGITAAAAAHRPLAALRLRAVLMQALTSGVPASAEALRLRASLARALRRDIPALVRRSLEAACRAPAAGAEPAGIPWLQPAGPAGVEEFLEIAQRARDDRAAIADVLAALAERVSAASVSVVAGDGRAIATAGRPWRDKPAAAAQAFASGQPVAVDELRQPLEAGEPVRCGGELIAAIGCRWVLGAAPVSRKTGPTLRAASLAIASHVRAALDDAVVEPPPAVWGDFLGDSAAAGALRESVQRASRAPFPVLIEGESGSGKELVARAIHRLSPRHGRRFCAINCAALSDDLVEAELFGHTRGAFTGATAERQGLFEDADGGTLFLDEVGELSGRAQAKLLRVLQEGEVRRVGENLPRRVDVRIVAATNRRLEQEAADGRFRTDLRFRLDVLRVVVPSLRERVGDVPMLAQHFWRQASARVGSHATLGPDTLAALSRYDWPGNVRELQNAIARIAVHAPRRGRVSAAVLPAYLASSPPATGSFDAAREEFERRFVRAALAQAGGQRQTAARALGISRQGLAKMLRRLGIEQNGLP